MNFPDLHPLGASGTMPDIQGSVDHRNLPIEQVGVRGVKYPVMIAQDNGSTAASVGEFSLSVGLPADQKGTHMLLAVATCRGTVAAFGMQRSLGQLVR